MDASAISPSIHKGSQNIPDSQSQRTSDQGMEPQYSGLANPCTQIISAFNHDTTAIFIASNNLLSPNLLELALGHTTVR